MPRTTADTSQLSNHQSSPYSRLHSIVPDAATQPGNHYHNSNEDVKPQMSTTPSPKAKGPGTKKVASGSSKGNGATSWTAHELKTLFRFALTREGRCWDEAVPGRSGSQSRQAWSCVTVSVSVSVSCLSPFCFSLSFSHPPYHPLG